ncbi:YcnI family protein [Cohnella suwonensis]|uniref:YcnI family protein n=1 Tax=Cohnella suwonensis TaxID=696072 RepID=A0ABW0LT27_9BACL
MKKSIILVFALLLTFGFASLASAHVTVQPKEAPAGSYQVFTMRVPSEKESATTQVKVAVPEGAAVSRVEAKAGWTYAFEKGADDKVVSITWKADGAGIGATEFAEFRFQGKVADDAKELVWKAYQTYADGVVIEWTGAPDADKPASVTAVTAATGDGHGDGHGAASATGDDADEQEENEGRDTLTLSLAIAGLVAGVLALIVAVFRKRT